MEDKNARKTKYNRKTYDQILLRIRRDGAANVTAADIKSAAARAGLSVNAYILSAIQAAMSVSEDEILTITTNGYATIDEADLVDFWTEA